MQLFNYTYSIIMSPPVIFEIIYKIKYKTMNEIDVGSQLASQLLKNFENQLEKNLAKLKQ